MFEYFNVNRLYFFLIGVGFIISLLSCQNPDDKSEAKDIVKSGVPKFELSAKQAKIIFDMPVHCITVEYPNKLGQSIGSDADLKPPRVLRPIFYGCFDWHSSVHGYWSIVKLMKSFKDLDQNDEVRGTLNAMITDKNAEIEKSFFEDKNNLSFERTYGWAWLFKLQEELITWEDADAKRWSQSLQPMVDLLRGKLLDYLPKLVYPIRSGKHDNTAFGLSLMYDYALTAKDEALADAITEHAIRLYQNDKNCDFSYEPSGSDFLSPCLEEAYLMSKVLDNRAYKTWLNEFLPQMYAEDFKLEPAIVKDRTDGQLVHLDGLNYSRAACLYGIAHQVPALAHLREIADAHLAFTLPNLGKEDDYMGSHWLGTFALYAITHQ
ncbi:DUF2891 domain-containing protein [Sphingobacterium corticibacter]|uniref:DUF2891 domain-containing protein n=1 Tax=Sphingobacterium corticibacter TaxID=2171749 RepID=A0A2T8HHZ9_9SPHI|nr:DUF2891 domain-containing protein [Sphingobacterium corticibacter]PVH25035.1 DUF2891 domain-containing protein [Sphingobacterium corticibacter]